jgi:hypothetical protein
VAGSRELRNEPSGSTKSERLSASQGGLPYMYFVSSILIMHAIWKKVPDLTDRASNTTAQNVT